jgi:LPXTG-motif cell wall-anchored protein
VASGAFTPTVAGTYRWVASYSGDANNAAVSGFCGDAAETVVVSPTPNVDDELPETGPAGMYVTLWGGAASMLLGGLLLGFTSRRRRHNWL